MKYWYHAIFTPDGEGYRVTVPDLPGTITYGNSFIEAWDMAKDAIELWLDDAVLNNENIPSPSNIFGVESSYGYLIAVSGTI